MAGAAAEPVPTRPGWLASTWNRQLDAYPDTAARVMYLAITVLATVTLYYELYVGGSVSTLQLVNLHMRADRGQGEGPDRRGHRGGAAAPVPAARARW
jgi:hypothetical protein